MTHLGCVGNAAYKERIDGEVRKIVATGVISEGVCQMIIDVSERRKKGSLRVIRFRQ